MFQLAQIYFVHLLLRTTVFVYSQLLSRRTPVSGGSRGGAPPPLTFRPNLGPKGRQNFLLSPGSSLISGSGWPPPPLFDSLDPPLHPHTNSIKNYVYCLQLPLFWWHLPQCYHQIIQTASRRVFWMQQWIQMWQAKIQPLYLHCRLCRCHPQTIFIQVLWS